MYIVENNIRIPSSTTTLATALRTNPYDELTLASRIACTRKVSSSILLINAYIQLIMVRVSCWAFPRIAQRGACSMELTERHLVQLSGAHVLRRFCTEECCAESKGILNFW